MHVLERNKQSIWYANPNGFTYKTDSNGFKTGTKDITYDLPTELRMSMAISSGANNLGSQGIAEVEPYGIVTGYTHRAVTDDLTCPITEESRIWYGIPATKTVIVGGKETTVATPYNFVVVRKSKSLTHLTYYLKEVDVQ